MRIFPRQPIPLGPTDDVEASAAAHIQKPIWALRPARHRVDRVYTPEEWHNAMNAIYPDGSGKLHVGTRVLQVDFDQLVKLIKAGVEFFYFDGGVFHVEHGVDIAEKLKQALGLGKPKRKRMVPKAGRLATRVLRVTVTSPDGKEFEISNLLAWMKNEFPEKYKAYYFAAVRGQAFGGYRAKKQGWVTMTVVGGTEFIKNSRGENGRQP